MSRLQTNIMDYRAKKKKEKKEKLREIPSVLRSILENKILRNLHKHPQMQTEKETKPSSSIAEQGCKKCQRATNGTGLT